jgi:hypothetical protein
MSLPQSPISSVTRIYSGTWAMSMMTSSQVADRGEALFQQGFCCAESVLQALAEIAGAILEQASRQQDGQGR